MPKKMQNFIRELEKLQPKETRTENDRIDIKILMDQVEFGFTDLKKKQALDQLYKQYGKKYVDQVNIEEIKPSDNINWGGLAYSEMKAKERARLN